MSEQPEDPDPSFPSPKRPTPATNIEERLAKIAAESGGRLVVELRHPTLAPIPLPQKGHRPGRCPRCDATQFSYELGDIYARCGGCGAQVDPDEDLV